MTSSCLALFSYRVDHIYSHCPSLALLTVDRPPYNITFGFTDTRYQNTQLTMSDNSSTLKSYADSAYGTMKSGVAYVTGSAGDQVCAAHKYNKSIC